MIERLHAEGEVFKTESGGRWTFAGHIDFLLYKRSLDGVTIEPLLAERYAAGSRVVCTLGMAHYIERFDPRDYGDVYYSHLKPFARALAAMDFYWMPIIFADAQVILPNQRDQHRHFARLVQELAGEPNILPSLGNEVWKNGVKPEAFQKPEGTGCLWSRGSGLMDQDCPRPAWDWVEYHPRRDWPKVLWGVNEGWYVKEGRGENGHVSDPPKPGAATEPIGFWSHDVPGRRSSSPDLARVIGHTCVDFMRGGNFHSENGLRSESWDARTTECAVQFFQGMRCAQGF